VVREDRGHAAFVRHRDFSGRDHNLLLYSLADDFSGSIDVDWVDSFGVGLRLNHVVRAQSRHNLGGLPSNVHIVQLPVPALSSEPRVRISIDLQVLFSTHG
jgi:hypothetical protein